MTLQTRHVFISLLRDRPGLFTNNKKNQVKSNEIFSGKGKIKCWGDSWQGKNTT